MSNTVHTGCDGMVDGDAVTEMALAINQTMLRSSAARAAYLATWGVEWIALPTVGGEAFFPDATEAKSYASSTLAKTNMAKGTK